jgi:AraC-like DNA-binding protein
VVTLFRPDPLDRLQAMIARLALEEGRSSAGEDICVYRLSSCTPIRKGASFGVVLGVVVQGEKHVRIDGHELVVDRERMLVITRDIEYDDLAVVGSEARPFLGLSIAFSSERVANALLSLADAGGPSTGESVPAFALPIDPDLVDAIERLLRAQVDPLDRRLIAPLVRDEILVRLLRTDAAATVRAGVGPAQDATRILDAMQFIRAHHKNKLTVEELARKVAMSASHFAHRFTAVARMSPMRYVREVRLDRARSLLGEHGARASEVASRVGFESPAHFAREFKRRFGVSPSRYRS